MRDGLMADIMGMIDAALLENNIMEEDFEAIREKTNIKVFAGITAGSMIAAGGFLLVCRLYSKGLFSPLLKNKA